MTRWVIRTPTTDCAPAVAAARAGREVVACSAGPDLPGTVGGLGMTWDLTTTAPPSSVLDLSASADAVPLIPVAAQHVPFVGRRIKRTLLLRVRPGTPDGIRARFEADLTAMPAHITAIRSWALSRVDTARQPSAPWTHVWEQEFIDPDGLNGEYLLHPYHWTHVDRWFDAEIPNAIVEPAIAHLFRWADQPILR